MYILSPGFVNTPCVVVQPDSTEFVGFEKLPAVVVLNVESFFLKSSTVFTDCPAPPVSPVTFTGVDQVYVNA